MSRLIPRSGGWPESPIALARGGAGVLQDVVARLVGTTRLGAAAQWRLVGDGLSGALLHQGKRAGLVAVRGPCRSILADRSTRLHSRQTDSSKSSSPA